MGPKYEIATRAWPNKFTDKEGGANWTVGGANWTLGGANWTFIKL